MIITLSGTAGSGKSTVAKMLAKKLKLKHCSMGDLQRRFAQERGITLAALARLEEKDPALDRKIDEIQGLLSKTEKNFVIDSRLGAFFIKDANLKVFLDADIYERAERILHDKHTRREEDIESKEQLVASIKARERSEKLRYRKYYDIDYHDRKHYDVVIGTTKLKPEDVMKKIAERLKSFSMFGFLGYGITS